MKASLFRSTCFVALAAFAVFPALAQDSISTSGALSAGDETLSAGEYLDEYRIDVNAGDLLDVRVTSDEFDTYLIVSGPNDTSFDNDDADGSTNSRILERVPVSGSYRIGVTSYEPGETGSYVLQASASAGRVTSGLTSSERGQLASGDGTLSSGEYADAYTFRGQAGDLVEIRVNSDDFDTYLMLRGPDDATFDNDDVEPGNTNSQISATLPESGEYRLSVTSYAAEETGSYALDVDGAEIIFAANRDARERFGNTQSGGRFSVGSPASGTLRASDPQLDSGEYYDSYTLEAAPGSRLAVSMRSDQFDTYLAVFGSDGSATSNDDDDNGGTTNSLLEIVVPASGEVTIVTTSYAGEETGSYSLSAAVSTAAGGPVDVSNSDPIALGDSVNGALSGGEAEGSYVLTTRGAEDVDFALSSGDFDTILRIEGPGGFVMENDDDPVSRTLDSRIQTTLPEAGDYRITVSSYGENSGGSYRLTTRQVSGSAQGPAQGRGQAAAALALGDKLTGNLASSDATFGGTGEYVDYFEFEGERGQRINLEMESNDFDTFLSLNFPDGGQETNDDRAGMDEGTNSRIAMALPEDGTYRLAATSYAEGETGTYTLSMETLDSSVRTILAPSTGSRVFALNVGVADYDRINSLDLTDRDAIKLTQTLEAAGVLAPESVTLVNSDATRANFVAAFNNIAAQIGPDDLFLLFFSGHGDKVEGVDTELDGSSETIELFDVALHDYELAEMFANVDARTLLVIDSCFSGGFDNIIDQSVDRMGIFSSDSDVLSLVADKFEAGGYVSLLMRQALEGQADINGDLAITAGELSEYMRRGFYEIALEAPLETTTEDFRGRESLGYQHLIVDRGGDGMPYSQVLMRIERTGGTTLSMAD